MTQPETEIRRRMATRRRASPRRLHRRLADQVRRAASPLPHRDAHHVRAPPRARHVARRSAAGLDAVPSAEVIAAALYHDAIYDPRPTTTRRVSAVLGRQRPRRDRLVRPRCDCGRGDDRGHRRPLGDPAVSFATPATDRRDGDAARRRPGHPGRRARRLPGVRQRRARRVRATSTTPVAHRAIGGAAAASSIARDCSSPTTCTPRSSTGRRANIEAELAALSHRHPE